MAHWFVLMAPVQCAEFALNRFQVSPNLQVTLFYHQGAENLAEAESIMAQAEKVGGLERDLAAHVSN